MKTIRINDKNNFFENKVDLRENINRKYWGKFSSKKEENLSWFKKLDGNRTAKGELQLWESVLLFTIEI